MYRIERMELVGFKSFCERTEVKFPSGVTVVVGPNGCGKSNLGDALSWVLGEQSARAVRSEKMEDVIFGGTEGRRALGMAEVTLVLTRLGAGGNGSGANGNVGGRATAAGGNGGGAPHLAGSGGGGGTDGATDAAPIPDGIPVLEPQDADGDAAARDHSDSPTLVVSRRVFRSGESEYMMNGRRCRLRDIHDTLYGTGLGTRAYSVIEQGKVDTILAGKPRERRLLIEEAAGILGYKVKKRAAWLKLEATQANLLRIQDLVGEVDRQIGSLKRQAARARRFRRLQEEARQRARWIFVHRRIEAERARGEGRDSLRVLTEREAELSAALARESAQTEAREHLREEVRGSLRAADEALAALERRHDQQQALVQQHREQQNAAQDQAGALHSEAAGLRGEAGALAGEAEHSGREGQALAEEAGRTAREAADADAGFKAALDGLQEAGTRAEQERRALFEALDRASHARAQGATLDENLRAGRARLERLSLERAQIRREAQEAAQLQESHARRRAEAQSEIARAQEQVHAAARERKRREEEREAGAREAAAFAGRLEGLEEFRRTLARLEAEEQAQAPEDPAPRVADFLEADAETEPAVEAYAEDWLASRLLDTGELPALASRLRANGPRFWIPRPQAKLEMPPADPRILGRLSDRVRPRGPHAEGIRSRLDSALLVRDGGDALALAAVLPAFDLVALDGTVVTGRGEVFQRQRGAPELGLLGRRRLSRQAGTECDELRRLLGEQEVRGAELTRLGREAGEQENAAAQRVATLGRELATLAAREGELAVARQRLVGRERLLDEEAASLTDDLSAWERGAEKAREEIATGDDLRRALETSAARAQEDAERRREGLAALHAMLESSRTRQAEAERLKAVQAQKAEALLRRAADLARRADSLDDQARAALERGRALSEQVRASEEGLKSLLAERARAQEARSSRERQGEDLRLAAEAGQETLRTLQSDLEAARQEARDRQVALARTDSDWEHLSHESRQELDMPIEQVMCAEGEALPERAACEQELAELREDLNRLGPVNLLALDEYQELEKRHEFLTSQYKDLEQSVESLKNTIQRLNRRSREQFVTAFEAIRTHFHELFRLLFGGGRAELHLEEGEDVLECGLEVNVQPPGKRLQSIQLLSGGEKALAALALLFSIFRYKPSPFCLLDEVDAALDESNVERFLRIVRDFQQNTQFVLITHNKRSMEIGDFLYGVTMEEPGVSKLVSVNLA